LYGCETCALTIREGHRTTVISQKSGEKNIWSEEVSNNMQLQKNAQLGFSLPVLINDHKQNDFKSRRSRWTVNVARMGRIECHTGFFFGRKLRI
jgi:hypothetical protein